MTPWDALAAELDAWHASGARATLWWRDDDACDDTPALQRLLALAECHAIPLALAVIPARLEARLCRTLAGSAMTTVVQHGYAHENHGARGARSAELGPDRPVATVLAELREGRHTLDTTFHERFAPVLVPPWNRIDPSIVAALPQVALAGVSTFGPRANASPAPGVVQCNTHVDLVAWRAGRVFIGVDRALERLVAHLAARRATSVDRHEASGLLTHHLDVADDAWQFLHELLARTARHPAVEWLDVRRLFARAELRGEGVTCARSA